MGLAPSWIEGAFDKPAAYLVGAGLSREWSHAVPGTGFAGVRGTSPLPQRRCCPGLIAGKPAPTGDTPRFSMLGVYLEGRLMPKFLNLPRSWWKQLSCSTSES